MGRHNTHGDHEAKVELYVHVCPLDQGYDEGGAYWGEGQPLWRAVAPDGGIEFFMRAADREAAIDMVYEEYPKAGVLPTPRERWVEEFVQGYMTCALWSSTDEEHDGMEGFPIDPVTQAKMRVDCEDFIDSVPEGIWKVVFEEYDYSYTQAGHDFWLTRNHHGAGYWDRGLGKFGEKLTELAHAAGECYLYVSGDTVYQA